jgi:hypothetical protein
MGWSTFDVEVDQVVWPLHHQPKRMITVFFSSIGQSLYLLNIGLETAAIDFHDLLAF